MNKKKVVIIGETSLCLECCKKVFSSGFDLSIVVSDDLKIKKWCNDNNIGHLNYKSLNDIHINNFVLLSIVNPILIKNDFIKDKNIILAINYHDSLLPKYAGLNSTTWSIFNEEIYHGITYHLIDNKIDQGDIIIQEKVEINNYDSTYTLNQKCARLALDLFDRLIKLIMIEKLSYSKQSIKDGSYYGAGQLPEDFGFINGKPLNNIIRSSKALYFGPTSNNTVSTVKLMLQDCYFIINYSDVINNLETTSIDDFIDLCIDEKLIVNGYGEYVKDIDASYLKSRYRLNVNVTERERKILFTVKKNERYNYTKLFNLKGIDNIPLRNYTNEVNNKLKYITSIKTHNSKSSLLLILISLQRILRQDFLVTIYDTISQESQIKNIIDYKKIIPLHKDFNKETVKDLLNYIGKIKTKGITKDFFHRYSLQFLLTDIAVTYDKENFENLPDSHVVIFNIKNNDIEIYSKIDNSIINTIESVITELSCNSIEDSDKLYNLNILSKNDYKKLIYEFNSTEKAYPNTKTIYELFIEQVNISKKKYAISFNDIKLTYEDINKKVTKVSDYLNYVCIQNNHKNPYIALYSEKNIDMIIAILAILRSGYAYVPILYKEASERIKYILLDTRCEIVLTTKELDNSLEDLSIRNYSKTIINISDNSLENSNKYSIYESKKIKSDYPAYVIYTSGSTGTPKGVIVSHKACLNTIYSSLTDEYKRVSLWTNYTFDVSVYQIFSTLLRGSELFIIPENLRLDPSKFWKYIEDKRIEHCYLPKAFMFSMPDNINSLKSVLIGVEPISKIDIKKLIDNNVEINNAYGLTETSICNTKLRFYNYQDIEKYEYLPIGKPIENNKIYILDEYMKPVPVGVKGEIYISGPSLSNGYLNLKDLTNSKFLNNPFEVSDLDDYSKVYKTGDLGVFDSLGNIKFIGRDDNQLKINGYRINLTEIEKKLLNIDEIIEGTILVLRDTITDP